MFILLFELRFKQNRGNIFLGEAVMAKAKMPHPNHGKHLCYLNNIGFQVSDPEGYKALVKGGKFFCRVCGRVGAYEKNLCKPAKL